MSQNGIVLCFEEFNCHPKRSRRLFFQFWKLLFCSPLYCLLSLRWAMTVDGFDEMLLSRLFNVHMRKQLTRESEGRATRVNLEEMLNKQIFKKLKMFPLWWSSTTSFVAAIVCCYTSIRRRWMCVNFRSASNRLPLIIVELKAAYECSPWARGEEKKKPEKKNLKLLPRVTHQRYNVGVKNCRCVRNTILSYIVSAWALDSTIYVITTRRASTHKQSAESFFLPCSKFIKIKWKRLRKFSPFHPHSAHNFFIFSLCDGEDLCFFFLLLSSFFFLSLLTKMSRNVSSIISAGPRFEHAISMWFGREKKK